MGFAVGNAAGAVTLDDAAVEVATTVAVWALDAAAQSFEGRNTSMLILEPLICRIASIIVLKSQSGPVSRMLLTETISENIYVGEKKEKKSEGVRAKGCCSART